jgi:hypothetical protein
MGKSSNTKSGCGGAQWVFAALWFLPFALFIVFIFAGAWVYPVFIFNTGSAKYQIGAQGYDTTANDEL